MPMVFISTYLESEQVERIRGVAPDQVQVIYEPDLLAPTRYVADHKGVDGFERSPEQETRWRAHLAAADILWDFPPASADGTPGMEIASNVKWIQTTSSGVGQHVARLGLQHKDLLITTARGVHAGPLAEFFLLSVLMHVKQLGFLKGEQKARRWARYCGDDLAGKTLALIGPGKVGRRIAAVARALGMRVLAMGGRLKSGDEAAASFDAVYGRADFHAMLVKADVVAIAAPHTSETEGLFDAAAFAAMKDGVVFVNVGRGAIVDEAVLTAALRSGRVGFAGLDVFAVEPLPEGSPLWDMPNVLVSPHSASTVSSENAKITDIFCHNMRCYLDGRISDMENILDKTRMY